MLRKRRNIGRHLPEAKNRHVTLKGIIRMRNHTRRGSQSYGMEENIGHDEPFNYFRHTCLKGIYWRGDFFFPLNILTNVKNFPFQTFKKYVNVCFLKCFLFKNIFFIFKNLFLILEHQNNPKIITNLPHHNSFIKGVFENVI